MKAENIKETFELAIQNHKENNFEIAEKLYKGILNIDPVILNQFIFWVHWQHRSKILIKRKNFLKER